MNRIVCWILSALMGAGAVGCAGVGTHPEKPIEVGHGGTEEPRLGPPKPVAPSAPVPEKLRDLGAEQTPEPPVDDPAPDDMDNSVENKARVGVGDMEAMLNEQLLQELKGASRPTSAMIGAPPPPQSDAGGGGKQGGLALHAPKSDHPSRIKTVVQAENIDRAVAASSVDVSHQSVLACYETALVQTPSVAGVIKLELEVGKDGKVKKAGVVENDVGSAGLAACIASALAGSAFPPPSASDARVIVTLDLEPAPAPAMR